MGHERLGFLPRTTQWRKLVDLIGETAAVGPVGMPRLLDQTLDRVAKKLAEVEKDSGVIACFAFLVRFSLLRTGTAPEGLAGELGVPSGSIGPLELTSKLKAFAREHANSLEYLEIATAAAGQAIVEWRAQREVIGQQELFSAQETGKDLWNAAGTTAGFCELSRLFFARFTERHLAYYLDRELATTAGDLKKVAEFRHNLALQVDAVSKHAFDISRLTQSYAAGWITNVHREHRATDRHVQKFISHALGKIRTELHSEAQGVE